MHGYSSSKIIMSIAQYISNQMTRSKTSAIIQKALQVYPDSFYSAMRGLEAARRAAPRPEPSLDCSIMMFLESSSPNNSSIIRHLRMKSFITKHTKNNKIHTSFKQDIYNDEPENNHELTFPLLLSFFHEMVLPQGVPLSNN